MGKKQRAIIKLPDGGSFTLRPLTRRDVQKLYFCYRGLFDTLVAMHRAGQLELEKLWPLMLPAICSAIALAAGEPDEAKTVAALPFPVFD